MVKGLLDRAASVLERRFLKNAFLPVLLFFPAAAAPSLFQAGRLNRLVSTWERQSPTVKILECVGYIAVTWFFAAILASQWRNIIRLFEGYPLDKIPWLRRMGEEWHRRRANELLTSPAWYLRYYGYPPNNNDIMPTRLGNILRAAERYPYERYGADPILLWPRLYHIIPREFVEDVEDARATLEFLLVIALWCVGFAYINILVLPAIGSPDYLIVICFVGGIAAAYASYLSGLRAATEYGEQLRAGIELYRLDLLQRLKVKPPGNLEEERERWRAVTELLGQGRRRRAWNYVEPGAPELIIRVR